MFRSTRLAWLAPLGTLCFIAIVSSPGIQSQAFAQDPEPAEPAPASAPEQPTEPAEPPAPLANPGIPAPSANLPQPPLPTSSGKNVMLPEPWATPVPQSVYLPPIALPASAFGFYSLELRVQPAHGIAMMEVQGDLPETDPLVARASNLLDQLTARYLEDAPRIADLAIKRTAKLRTAGTKVSPLGLLDAALAAKRPESLKGNTPRRFDLFASAYRPDQPRGQ